MRNFICSIGCLLLVVGNATAQGTPQAPVPDETWKSIFDGRSLSGWEVQKSDEGQWTVKPGAQGGPGELHGNNPENFHYFGGVKTKKKYGDMALSFEVFLERGGVAVRKWTFFTVHFTEEQVPVGRWVKIVFIHDGEYVLPWIEGKFVSLTQQKFRAARQNLTLMLNKNSKARFRNIRVKVVGEEEGGESEEQKPAASPEVGPEKRVEDVRSKGTTLFNGKDLDAWFGSGARKLLSEEGKARILLGDRELKKMALLYTGKSEWAEGTYTFQFRGLAKGERLITLVNLDTGAQKATELQIQGQEGMDPQRWTTVLLEVRGDEIVAYISGQRVTLPRKTKQGRFGFLAPAGSDCELREIYVRLNP